MLAALRGASALAVTVLALLPLALLRLLGPFCSLVVHDAVAVGDALGIDMAGVLAGVTLGVSPLHLAHVDGAPLRSLLWLWWVELCSLLPLLWGLFFFLILSLW